LIAAQHRLRPADDAEQDGKVCLGRDLERTEIEPGQAGPSGEGPLREEHQGTALVHVRDQRRGSEQVDEAPKAVESEAVEVERELPAEDNPSIERAEPLSRSTSPMFED